MKPNLEMKDENMNYKIKLYIVNIINQNNIFAIINNYNNLVSRTNITIINKIYIAIIIQSIVL